MSDPVPPIDSPCASMLHADGVAFLMVHNPPVNAFSQRVRRSLARMLEDQRTDTRASAVVIASAGAMFSGGGDLRELGQPEPPGGTSLGELAALIEEFPKPVVAALQGKAIGGGVLIAMACHARIGAHDAQLALPEINLGFVPGAGGTQRLPRLVGVQAALRMVALAQPMDAAAALAAGLLDAWVAPGDSLRDAAAALARSLARDQRPWRRTSALAVPGGAAAPALIAQYRALAAERFADRQAAQDAITLITRAAELPFEAGVVEERAAYERLSSSQQTRDLLAEFFAGRAAARARAAAARGEVAPGAVA